MTRHKAGQTAKRKKTELSSDDNDESIINISLDIKNDDVIEEDGAGVGAPDPGDDFETYVRKSLSNIQITMKKQQSSINKIFQAQICIKSDIKSIDKVSSLTTRVSVIEQSVESLNSDFVALKPEIDKNKSNIEKMARVQESHKTELLSAKTLVEKSSARVDILDNSVSAIKSTVSSNKNTLKSYDDEINDIFKRNTQLEDDLSYAIDQLELAKDHCNRLERFSRENNLRLLNFGEDRNENPLDIVKRVAAKIGLRNCEIMKAHRTGKNAVIGGRTMPRQIIFKCLRHCDKHFLITNQRQKLSDVPFFLIDDLTDQDLQTRRSLKDVIDNAVKEKKRWKFRNGKLVIEGQVYKQ